MISMVLASAAIVAAVIIGSTGGQRPFGIANAATGGVSIKSFAFSPATISIKAGDTVKWTNDEDSVPHTVTSEQYPGFASPTLKPGESFSQQFDKAGAFTYLCLIHTRMRGVVLVGDATGAPSAAASPLPASPITLRLAGKEEVPAVTTVANGSFVATPSATSLKWGLQAYGVGLTMSHIHVGAAGANGPVVAFLFGPNAAGQNLVDVSGTITEANLVGPMLGKYGDFAAALAAGNLYVNVHSIANPGGEVRIQIPAQAPASTPAPVPPSTGSGSAQSDAGLSVSPAAGLIALGIAAMGLAGAMEMRRRRSR